MQMPQRMRVHLISSSGIDLKFWPKTRETATCRPAGGDRTEDASV